MKTIKENLKTDANTIKKIKNDMKNGMRKGKYVWREQGDLLRMQHDFRYHHIAYCMLRGREYHEIENKVKPNNEINMDRVERIIEEMKDDILKRNPKEEDQHA